MRISDWSSDVCSADLLAQQCLEHTTRALQLRAQVGIPGERGLALRGNQRARAQRGVERIQTGQRVAVTLRQGVQRRLLQQRGVYRGEQCRQRRATRVVKAGGRRIEPRPPPRLPPVEVTSRVAGLALRGNQRARGQRGGERIQTGQRVAVTLRQGVQRRLLQQRGVYRGEQCRQRRATRVGKAGGRRIEPRPPPRLQLVEVTSRVAGLALQLAQPHSQPAQILAAQRYRLGQCEYVGTECRQRPGPSV